MSWKKCRANDSRQAMGLNRYLWSNECCVPERARRGRTSLGEVLAGEERSASQDVDGLMVRFEVEQPMFKRVADQCGAAL